MQWQTSSWKSYVHSVTSLHGVIFDSAWVQGISMSCMLYNYGISKTLPLFTILPRPWELKSSRLWHCFIGLKISDVPKDYSASSSGSGSQRQVLHPKDGGTKILRNVGNHLPNDTMSHPSNTAVITPDIVLVYCPHYTERPIILMNTPNRFTRVSAVNPQRINSFRCVFYIRIIP